MAELHATPQTEIRLTLATAAALLVLPQIVLATVLFAAVSWARHDAPMAHHVQRADAETVPIAPWPTPSALRDDANELRGLLEAIRSSSGAKSPSAKPTREVLPLKPLLDRVLANADTPQTLDDRWSLARESTETLANRIAAEIEGAAPLSELLDAAGAPGQDRLGEARALLGDLEGLQGTLGDLRKGGAGGGGAGHSLQQLGPVIAQVGALLQAFQGLRSGSAGMLGGDRQGLELLDQFLGRDEERSRRLGTLVLLAWLLDEAPEP